MKRSALVMLSGAVALGAVVAAPTASAGAAPSVSEVVMDAGPMVASGLDGTATVSISMRLTDPRGVADCSGFHDPPGMWVGHVQAVLARTGGGPPAYVEIWLTRVGGTITDGTWAGQWRAGSTRGGTWSLTQASWCVLDGNNETSAGVDLSPAPTVVIVGSQAPRMTWRRIPAVAAYDARQWVQYTFTAASGKPLAGVPVTFGLFHPPWGDSDYTDTCGVHGNGELLVAADGQGRVTRRLTMVVANMEGGGLGYYHYPNACVYLARPAEERLGDLVGVTLLLKEYLPEQYMTYARVTAVPSRTSASAGRRVLVTGTLAPARVWKVSLQRRVAGQWRTVRTVLTTPQGRYSVATQALARGTNVVRVLARGGRLLDTGGSVSGRVLAPTASRTLVLIGT